MSTKLSGTVATKGFNPVAGDPNNRYPNLAGILLSDDESEAYIFDGRNGRIVKYIIDSDASAMLTANDAIAGNIGNSLWAHPFWNADKTGIIIIDGSNAAGAGLNKSWSVDVSSGVVTPMSDLALVGGGVRSSQAIAPVRIDADHALAFNQNAQDGLWRYDYATHQITGNKHWLVPRWGTLPCVHDGRIYTMLGITNTYRGGPIVSIPADADSHDRNRIRWEVGHVAVAGSPMTSTLPCDRRLFTCPYVIQPVMDPDGDFLYWADPSVGNILCADMANGGQVTTLVSGTVWTYAVFRPSSNTIIGVKDNTTVIVIS